jgi:hypothetical protein
MTTLLIPALRLIPTRSKARATRIVLRTTRPDDTAALQDFVRALSPTSRRLRFHSALRELSEATLRALTHVGLGAADWRNGCWRHWSTRPVRPGCSGSSAMYWPTTRACSPSCAAAALPSRHAAQSPASFGWSAVWTGDWLRPMVWARGCKRPARSPVAGFVAASLAASCAVLPAVLIHHSPRTSAISIQMLMRD